MKPFKIAVIGAGAAGIFTAAAIKRNHPSIEVELVFDPKLKHIGVGESLGFSARIFFREILGLKNEREWMTESESTYKIGIRFAGWDNTDIMRYWGPGRSFHIGFTDPQKNYTLDEVWMHLHKKGLRTLDDFEYDFPEGRFTVNNETLTRQMHTYHINAEHTREVVHKLVGIPAGVKERPIPITDVILKPNGEEIDYLKLEDGTQVTADLFIDCTGFGKLLVKKLPYKFEHWPEHYNDTAIVGPYLYQHEYELKRCYTDHVAMDHGWSFSVPLVKRTGEGYISNSRIYSDHDKMINEWETVTGKKNIIGRVLKWEPGYQHDAFVGNCIVIGLGYGMCDPYDANVFTTSLKFIKKLVEYLGNDPERTLIWKNQFNQLLRDIIADIKLRIDVGLHLAPRNGTVYWQTMKEAARQERTLERVMESFYTQERKFQTFDKHVGQHSILEFLWYYGIDFPLENLPPLNISSYTEDLALKMFRQYNYIHRAMDLRDCYRLL